MSLAQQWLEISGTPDPDDEAGTSFNRFCREYIRHLQQLDGIHTFTDDLDHRQSILDALRGTYSVFAALAELKQQNGSPESPETISRTTAAVMQFLITASLEITAQIRAIEENHPELTRYFAGERKMFDQWLNDEGPMQGKPWGFDSTDNSNSSNKK